MENVKSRKTSSVLDSRIVERKVYMHTAFPGMYVLHAILRAGCDRKRRGCQQIERSIHFDQSLKTNMATKKLTRQEGQGK